MMLKLLWLMVFIAAAPASRAEMYPRASTLQLEANGHSIEAEIAATPRSRTVGLMFRTRLSGNGGMLFVFPDERVRCMWMKNTSIPLSAAFLDADGAIVNIAEMEPKTTQKYCASRPIRYVLEMNRGWFQKRSISAGARITGLEKGYIGK